MVHRHKLLAPDEKPLRWLHESCGSVTVRPRGWFKPPHFICEGCGALVTVSKREVKERYQAQMMKGDARARLSQTKPPQTRGFLTLIER